MASEKWLARVPVDDSPFVHVDAALHGNDALASKHAKHKLPFVARNCAHGKSRDVFVPVAVGGSGGVECVELGVIGDQCSPVAVVRCGDGVCVCARVRVCFGYISRCSNGLGHLEVGKHSCATSDPFISKI